MLRQTVLHGLASIRPRLRSLHVFGTGVSVLGKANAGRIGKPTLCFLGIGGGLLVGSLVGSTEALCDEEAHPSLSDDPNGEADPYANLPEEDEETGCTLCLTFRQGPCRPPWRKLERCFKDGEPTKCTKYFMEHQECVSGFMNLYHLIDLEQKQKLIEDTEKEVTENERVVWSKAVADSLVDWSQWRSFCKDMGPAFKESLQHPKKVLANDPENKLQPLWKRGPENTEPLLVATEAKLPTEQNGMLLKFAYVVDQDGFALGVAFHDYYRKLVELQEQITSTKDKTTDESFENTESDKSDADESKDEPLTLDKDISLEFYILPGDTRTVQICALYTENPSQVDESKKLLDAFLFKTVEYQLKHQC